ELFESPALYDQAPGRHRMSKIRINELARELEVKPSVIIDLLPELGVTDKKTHSSSLDEDIAFQLRQRLTGTGGPEHAFVDEVDEPSSNGHGSHAHEEPAPVHAPPAAKTDHLSRPEAIAKSDHKPEQVSKPEVAPSAPEAPREVPEDLSQPTRSAHPLRPPLATGLPVAPPLSPAHPPSPTPAPGTV